MIPIVYRNMDSYSVPRLSYSAPSYLSYFLGLLECLGLLHLLGLLEVLGLLVSLGLLQCLGLLGLKSKPRHSSNPSN